MGECGGGGIALAEDAGWGRGGDGISSRFAGLRKSWALLDDVRRIRDPSGDESRKLGVRGGSAESSAIM